MNAPRTIAALSITLLLCWHPGIISMKKHQYPQPSAWHQQIPKEQVQKPLPATPQAETVKTETPPTSPETPKQSEQSKTVTASTTPEAAKQSASPTNLPQQTQTTVKTEIVSVADILKQKKKPTIEVDSSWTNYLSLNTSAIAPAITKLKELSDDASSSPTSNTKITRVTHDCDWAINEIADTILKLNDQHKQKDAYTLRIIIDKSKPYIINLREIVDLVEKKDVQLADAKIRQIQETFEFFDMLGKSYATLCINEVSEMLRENKSRRKIAKALIAKPIKEDLLSDDEYTDNADLFDKVDDLTTKLREQKK